MLGRGKAQTTAIPAGIAQICNAAMAQKTRFYVPDSVQHCTRRRASVMILPGTDPQAVLEAARRIQAGQLVGFPTETVYGLGADASSDPAVAGIFSAKGRPPDHPLIVHLADAGQVSDYASRVPPFAARLIQAFWPGPLT